MQIIVKILKSRLNENENIVSIHLKYLENQENFELAFKLAELQGIEKHNGSKLIDLKDIENKPVDYFFSENHGMVRISKNFFFMFYFCIFSRFWI